MEFGQKDRGWKFQSQAKGREGRRGILFLDNPGASVTKILLIPYSLAISITKSGLCKFCPCPVTSWFAIWLGFCVLCFRNRSILKILRSQFIRLPAWDRGSGTQASHHPAQPVLQHPDEFYFPRVVWLGDLPPACPVCTAPSPTWWLKSSPLLTSWVEQCDALHVVLSSALWGKGGFPVFSPPQFRCTSFSWSFLLRPCSNPVSKGFSTWIQSESDLERSKFLLSFLFQCSQHMAKITCGFVAKTLTFEVF